MAEPQGWHREDIKAELRKRFGTMAAAARRWGYSESAITTVLQRANASIRLERLIAEAIGQTPHVLWPDRWTTEGAPLHRGKGWTRSRNDLATHSKISEAA